MATATHVPPVRRPVRTAMRWLLFFGTLVLAGFLANMSHVGVYDSAMQPQVARGAEVFYKPAETYETGDVVVVDTVYGKVVRVVDTVTNDGKLFTRTPDGAEDTWPVDLHVSNVAGEAVYVIPHLGNLLDIGFWSATLSSKSNWSDAFPWIVGALVLFWISSPNRRVKVKPSRRSAESTDSLVSAPALLAHSAATTVVLPVQGPRRLQDTLVDLRPVAAGRHTVRAGYRPQ